MSVAYVAYKYILCLFLFLSTQLVLLRGGLQHILVLLEYFSTLYISVRDLVRKCVMGGLSEH